MLKILTEASGSLSAAYLIKSIQDAGHIAIASDINPDCVGRYLANDFMHMPSKDDPELWKKMQCGLKEHQVNVVVPSLDETLVGWAERKEKFLEDGIHVILSPPDTVRICQDKWLTYQFFQEAGIPTPKTSLEQKYSLIKPRFGRGAVGVKIETDPVNMEGMISQEVVEGIEYTVDVFCDAQSKPIYVIPRRRSGVVQGKSTSGVVEKQPEIERWVNKICRTIPFLGPVNMQCFVQKDGTVSFIEINPRIGGGMALGFAASENWMKLIVDHFIYGQEILPKPIRYGLKMKRYYAEVFVSDN